MISFKWLTVPKSNETKQVEVLKLWRVEWKSVYTLSSYSEMYYTQTETEMFTTKEAADEFAEALRAARKLLKDRSGGQLNVVVKENV